MKYSLTFPKTLRKAPSDTVSVNHQLLIRAGFIHQEMAGVYTYLPLGWKVLDKISDIVREEMNAIGGQEVLMPALHPGEPWKKTGRFNSFDVLFKLKGAAGADLVLGPTHEEIIYPLLSEYIQSYKDLPLYLYQIQMKFRNEPRAKAGILRGREFLMKDLYSFHTSDEDRDEYYQKVREAYFKIFKRIELPVVKTKASGGTFSDLSEEFQTLTPSGEDIVLVCKECGSTTNREIVEDKKCLDCGGSLKMEKAIEVGNIFPLKRAYAEVFDLKFTDKDGEKKIVSAGCYGLGISRTMGALVEIYHDEKGIIWPEAVAPFQVHLVGLDGLGEREYKLLQAEGMEVLFDDRQVSAGEKFADSDLIGIPYRVVISKKTTPLRQGFEEQSKLEIKKRSEKQTQFLTLKELLDMLKL
ncbi:hypothetical protein HY387_00375 [Candidatus Daviesbacteria bacterium]|nr:hypothetical protein [Candidatus Daviesbacteria bacterium]